MFNIKRQIKYNKGPVSPSQGGLTLIELMVVISIFLVITTIVIFNYEGFSSNVSLQNLTDDIALSIRKAQSFAIGARGVTGNFSSSYGVHFSDNTTLPNSNLEASQKSFLMFSTASSSQGYKAVGSSCNDTTVGNKCMESFSIATLDIIKSIELNDGAIPFAAGSYLDIIFTRPNPRAIFCYRTDITLGDCLPISSTISSVKITISNGDPEKEKTKSISVQNTGQISIQ